MDKEQHRQEWAARTVAFRASGQTMKAWCAQQGYSVDQLKYWLYKSPSSTKSAPRPTQWVPVSFGSPAAGGCLLIHIGTARIEVSTGFHPELLRDVVRVLSTLC